MKICMQNVSLNSGFFHVTAGCGGHQDDMIIDARKPSKLLDSSSEFVLTYEDREGDWMLVGDVPWGYA